MRRSVVLPALIFVAGIVLVASAKEPTGQVIVWPQSGTPVLRFSFGKFKELGIVGSLRNYVVDTTAENLWTKKITSAVFDLYLFDKARVRIGEGWISLDNIGPGETIKFQTTIRASGSPVSVDVSPRSLPAELAPAAPPKTVAVTVNSTPQGAAVKLDGTDVGTTPKIVQVGVGKHILEFSKEGFNTGHFPLEITPNDTSGGSVSYELGTSAHDTIELRDGSVLSGDVESLSATDVTIRLGGQLQHYNRNQVKRISLIERDASTQP